MLHCLTRRQYEPSALLAGHPPKLRHPHKHLVFGLCCGPAAVHHGTIEVTRWLPPTHPESLPTVELVAGTFDYQGDDRGVWHLNFADPHLFFAYGSALLAQDELQVAEHPLLACVREALVAEGIPAQTEEQLRPTPVLVAGVERRCEISTAPSPTRPLGLYGNRFAAAPADVVCEATRVLAPPTRSNIIAISAPGGGIGTYTRSGLELVLVTAYTGFAAAVAESRRLWPGQPVELRTGFWGCGAFGGNRSVMTLLQLYAARLAEVDRVRFYAFDDRGRAAFAAGAAHLDELAAKTSSVSELVALVETHGYRWGMSDGN